MTTLNHTTKLRWIYTLIAVVLLCFLDAAPLVSQVPGTNDGAPAAATDQGNSAVREEVQRYFGYEDLLFRYLTLPYDLSQNVNQNGRHVDFGFALFAIMPLLLLILVYKRKRLFYGLAITLILYLGMCFNYSHVVTKQRLAVKYDTDLWSESAAGADKGVGESMLFDIYDAVATLATPLTTSLASITAASDHVTYPIISILFLFIIWGVYKSDRLSRQIKVTTLIFIAYTFLWYLLSGGIIWYGFLIFPLAYIITTYGIRRRVAHVPALVSTTFNYFSIGVLTIWLVSGYVFRVSNIDLQEPNELKGHLIADKALFWYANGRVNEEEALEFAAPNLPSALRFINNDDRRVYQVGTHLIFDIKNNHLRVFEDNTLAAFSELIKTKNSQGLLIDALKSYGFGYILIDLNLPSIDRTPERSLIKKYQILLQAMIDNPKVRLIATDRIGVVDVNGSMQEKYVVFAPEYTDRGNYAIYEIL